MLSDPDHEVKNKAAMMLSNFLPKMLPNFLPETEISRVCLLFCHIHRRIIYSSHAFLACLI